MARLALLSVSDKTGLVELAQALVSEFGFEIVSSGGTARTLAEAGLPVTKVSDYTGSPEILGGRVKTLHPRIHGGILARPDMAQDEADLVANHIRPFDLVVVNLYPFEQTIARLGVTLPEATEQIDIGGPTMVRAAAKNHAYLTILCQPSQYADYLEALRASQGQVPLSFRQACAQAAFWHTANYDQAIATYLTQASTDGEGMPPQWAMIGQQHATLRYGENPHQSAAWYRTGATATGWAGAEQLQGKELSYNNLVDLEAARRIIAEFPDDQPAAAVLKHTNPCGVAMGDTLATAYQRAYEADSTSAFGGIVVLNRAIDADTAQQLTGTFLECIVAPGCDAAAREILAKKQNLRVLVLEDLLTGPKQAVMAIAGGFLLQNPDTYRDDPATWQIVTEAKPNEADLSELLFAWRVVKHVKSNAIVVTNQHQTLGIGAGQMNRVGSVGIALTQAGDKAKGAILASDGFFPFDDSVRTAAAAGIRAIVQPGGSRKDEDSIKAANELGMIMALTGVRHFLH
ncbi:bifunctional phosphoribosylaminoimidazolecarboxamide formyltransferase/IMP cyclohydrolase [Phormidium sp. FACHB-1136]|uniref:bifunctional phosphoribosylaminoimidazolecarboxamide formyltransferase/IMP cyclohydrolase n=1 Tax=Phormidium sp. FACHB-1136 TaxID=2692848 RepID=UPI0016842FED|nr:bifunctional phosphoribosylaminoimidazolecarboxamide formyltransferase/IMP cyclohydrolase [Phormidium sp. FACHB-1136]MBD2427166.1 bifunctional phosphoribosylaminoimidazolecarboxamide formyltransferase/IMP cyclohydrolase [Phormidium sp. FACHB-1136]